MSDYNPFSLSDKRILITGASSGIGRACAIECSKLGANVILVARREDELQKTKALLAEGTHRIEIADLSLGEPLVYWLKDLAGRTGPLDGLVHSAGIAHVLPIRGVEADLFSALMSVNLGAAYWLAKGYRMRGVRATHGSLIFLSSVLGIVGQPGASAYCASKGALITLAKSLALEFSKENITVNCIAGGHVRTAITDQVTSSMPAENFRAIEAMHPLGIGSPEDIAHAAVYLLSDAARWVTGSTLVVDGGYTAA